MKHNIIIIITALSLLGCRAIKDRNSASQQTLQHSTHSTTKHWSFHDSSGRYWQYYSDSLLYFHPEVGLYGRGGWLSVSESQHRQSELQLTQDSTAYLSADAQQERTVTTSKRIPWWVWIAGILAICLAFGFGIVRKRIVS